MLEPYQKIVNKEDPDVLLEKLSKLMISKNKHDRKESKLEESKQSSDNSAPKTPNRSQKRSTSSERQLDNMNSSKPPLRASTKRSDISKKSSATKSIKYNRAEDDTEYIDMSIYDKNYNERQDDFIKERIKSQRKPKRSLAAQKKDSVRTEPKTALPSIRGRNKIKNPKYNLAKEGAIKDRKDKQSELSDKQQHEFEEDEKYDDRNPMLQSIIKYNESRGKLKFLYYTYRNSC